jgi:galactose mutarotase-like enzyme
MAVEKYRVQTTTDGTYVLPSRNLTNVGFEIKRLSGGLSDGVEVLTIRCGTKKVEILTTRGLGIGQAENEGVRFGWDSPIAGPVHPQFVPISEPSGLGWLDGFDEMMVRCGLGNNGAPDFDDNGQLVWPLHGRIANLPGSDVVVELDDDAGTISVSGIVNESRFHFYRLELATTISLSIDSDEIQIVDRVTNRSNRPATFQMLYHSNFGPPVLEAGAKFYGPVKKVAPRDDHAAKSIANWDTYAEADAGYAEEVFFMDVQADDNGQALVLVANADQSVAASLRYEAQNLPCFTLWKNTVGVADGYVTGMEPGTNFPNPRSFEESKGRVVKLSAGESSTLEMSIGMLVGKSTISSAIDEVRSIYSEKPEVAEQPDPSWSAMGG